MDLNGVEEVCRPRARSELPTWRPGDAPLAGGTWLFSEPQPGLRRLVDLTALGWPAAEVDADGLHLAATCTLAELERLDLPAGWAAASVLRPCCRALAGSFKVTGAATVGGNLCLALPASPVAALAAALRSGEPAVVARVAGGAVLLDLRAVAAAEFQALETAVRVAVGAAG